MLLLRMTAVDDDMVVSPGMPLGEVRVAGRSMPAITPSVSQSPQFRSTPTAPKKFGAIV